MERKPPRTTSRSLGETYSLNQILGPLPTMPGEWTLCTAILRVRRGQSAQQVVRFPGGLTHELDVHNDFTDCYAEFNLKCGPSNPLDRHSTKAESS